MAQMWLTVPKSLSIAQQSRNFVKKEFKNKSGSKRKITIKIAENRLFFSGKKKTAEEAIN